MKISLTLLIVSCFFTSASAQLTIYSKPDSASESSALPTIEDSESETATVHSFAVLPTDLLIGSMGLYYQHSFTHAISGEIGLGLTSWNMNLVRYPLMIATDQGDADSEQGSPGLMFSLNAKFYLTRNGIKRKKSGFMSIGYTYRSYNFIDDNPYPGEESRTMIWNQMQVNIGYRYSPASGFLFEVYTGYSPSWINVRLNGVSELEQYEELPIRQFWPSFGMKFGYHFKV